MDDLAAPIPDQEGNGHSGNHFHQGHEKGKNLHLFHAGLIGLVVDLPEIIEPFFLPDQDLNQGQAGKAFLEKGVQLGHPAAQVPEGIPGLSAEQTGTDKNHRDQGEGNQGQPEIQI